MVVRKRFQVVWLCFAISKGIVTCFCELSEETKVFKSEKLKEIELSNNNKLTN